MKRMIHRRMLYGFVRPYVCLVDALDIVSLPLEQSTM
jgi:hypothetical protein